MPYTVKRSLNAPGAFYCLGVSVFPITVTDSSEGHFRSPESLLFKHIPILLFLLFPFLLLTEKFLYLPRRFG